MVVPAGPFLEASETFTGSRIPFSNLLLSHANQLYLFHNFTTGRTAPCTERNLFRRPDSLLGICPDPPGLAGREDSHHAEYEEVILVLGHGY